jgi:hypothetical protein
VFWGIHLIRKDSQNILGKQGTAVPTRAKYNRLLPRQEPIICLSGKHPRTPLTQIPSAATHRSDAKLSRVIHDRALFLCVDLALRGHAILHNSPYER